MKYTLSLDIDKDRVTLIRVAPGDKDGLLSLKGAVTGPVSSANPEDELPRTIKALLQEHHIREKEVVLIASVSARNNDAFLGRFYLPVMPLSEARAAVVWEARSVMPFDPRGALFNYRLEGKVRDKHGLEKITVLVGAIKMKEARRLTDLATQAGLTPIRLLHPFSALALFFQESTLSDTTILLNAGQTTELLIYKKGQFEFERRIDNGEDELDRRLTGAGVEPAQFPLLKNEYGLLSAPDLSRLSLSEPPPGVEEIRTFVDELAIKTRRSLKEWVEERGEEIVEKIYLIGSLAHLRNLVPYLAKKLRLEVIAGTAASLGVELSPPPETALPELSLLLPALGASWGRKTAIELLPPEAKLQRKLTQVKMGIRVSLVLVIGSILLLSFLARLSSLAWRRTVATKRAEVAALRDDPGAGAGAGKREELTGKLAHYQALAGWRRPLWAAALRELTHITPGGIYFREMQLEGEEATLLIKGIVLPREDVPPEGVLDRLVGGIEGSPFFRGASLLNIEDYRGPAASGGPARSFSLSIILRKLPLEVFKK